MIAPSRSGGRDARDKPTGAAAAAPEWHAGTGGFQDCRRTAAGAERRRGIAARHLSVARSVYARPDQRRALLCPPRRDRRAYRGTGRGTGRALARSRLARGRLRVWRLWLAALQRGAGEQPVAA